MTRTTFHRLREVKDSLPHGSSAVIAAELGITADDVRDFFRGGASDCSGKLGNPGYHVAPGPDGGIVTIEDTRILEVALRIAWEAKNGL